MLDKVRETIQEHQLLKENDRVIVAVSGGVDSVVLLHCLIQLQQEYHLSLMVAHLNHGFRGEEAAADAAFVSELAKAYGLPSRVEKTSVPSYMQETGLSAQEAARVVRYNFLEQARAEFLGNAIAVGQNANDLAETVLMNLLRGGAARGLKGIPIKRGHIIRPLLGITRKEIEDYAKQEGLAYRFDSSNAKDIYLRNKVRLQLLPMLEKEYNPELVTILNNTAKVLGAEDHYLQQQVEEAFESLVVSGVEGQYILLTEPFQKQHLAIKRRLLRLVCQRLKDEQMISLSFEHIEMMLRLIGQGQTGSRLILAGNLIMEKSYGQISFYVGHGEQEKNELTDLLFPIEIPGVTQIPQLQIAITSYIFSREEEQELDISRAGDVYSCSFDWDSIKDQGLLVRTRAEGDRFKPIGMKGATKKLKDYFVDEKVPRQLREQIPLLVTTGGDIVWVVGYRMSEQYKVKNTTRAILKLIVERTGQ